MSGPATASTASDRAQFPAYGPIEAILGYVLFYRIVEHVTPTVIDAVTDVLPETAPSVVGLGLAVLLWLVLGLNVIEQGRRQLGALGVLSSTPGPLHAWSPFTDVGGRLLGVALVLVGAAVAALTMETALDVLTSLVVLFVRLEAPSLAPYGIAAMVAFFVAYGVATHVLDRLVIDAVRAAVDTSS